MNKETYHALKDHMLGFMRDSAHDREHIYRVLYTALDIAGHEENVDLDVLTAACLLHDIGRVEQYKDPRVCHAEAGSEMAYAILLELGWAQTKAEHVRQCVLTHRFRNDRPPKSLEAKILFDADKIDATGALGIARTLIYQGQVSQPLYTAEDDRVLDGTGEEPPSFFHEYRFKLEKLYNIFYTKRGGEIDNGRRAAAEAFYKSLLSEAQGCYRDGKRRLDKILAGN